MGIGSQYAAKRYDWTPSAFAVAGTPKKVSMVVSEKSMTPRPPGVIGIAANTLATQNDTSSESGRTLSPNARRKTHSDAASNTQLTIAHPTRRHSVARFAANRRIRPPRRRITELTTPASTKENLRAMTLTMVSARSAPRTKRSTTTPNAPSTNTPAKATET